MSRFIKTPVAQWPAWWRWTIGVAVLLLIGLVAVVEVILRGAHEGIKATAGYAKDAADRLSEAAMAIIYGEEKP